MSHFLWLFEGETASTARQDPGALLSYLLKVYTRHFELGTRQNIWRWRERSNVRIVKTFLLLISWHKCSRYNSTNNEGLILPNFAFVLYENLEIGYMKHLNFTFVIIELVASNLFYRKTLRYFLNNPSVWFQYSSENECFYGSKK